MAYMKPVSNVCSERAFMPKYRPGRYEPQYNCELSLAASPSPSPASSASVVERSDTNTRTIEWNMSGGSTPHCKQCQQGGESSS